MPWPKGKPCPIETRQKISRGLLLSATIGRYERTPEIREKIAVGHRGVPLTDEHKKKISEGSKNIGKPAWNRGVCHTEEARQKISESNKGKVRSKEAIQHYSSASKKRWEDPACPLRIYASSLKSKETKAKMRKSALAVWATYDKKQKNLRIQQSLVRLSVHPNRPERLLRNLLSTFWPGEWKYVGNGSFLIGGLVPDFVNVNGQKKIIELFGRYWHQNRKDVGYHQTERGRRRIFARYGFQTLVIWDDELNNLDTVIGKIQIFMTLAGTKLMETTTYMENQP